jgi:hypothetical protein
MPAPQFPPEIVAFAAGITGQRARVVVEHILRLGFITTEDLEGYGYKHPPRAIQDVRDQGLPIPMTWTKNSTGRRIARYTFGAPSELRGEMGGGRGRLSKAFRDMVVAAHANRCAICHTEMEPRYLQSDHRIPFQIAGESPTPTIAEYMPLCGSCNRAKSWSCENCPNWAVKDAAVCGTCYWAQPTEYQHVATQDIRRLDLVWQAGEVTEFDHLRAEAEGMHVPLPDFVKRVLRASHPPPTPEESPPTETPPG